MKTKKTYSVYAVFLMLAGLLLFTAQGVEAATTKTAFTSVSASDAHTGLTSTPAAVMFDTRTVDENNGCRPPWNSPVCPDSNASYRGTPMWDVTVNNETVSKLPITVPYWTTQNSGTGAPEEEANTKSIIVKLLAAGVIDFDTPIYFICRTAYRSYYMADWMDDEQFYSEITGTTEYFENLINIDGDTAPVDPGNGLGGMQEWIASSRPLYMSGSSTASDYYVPPQIFSITPEDGKTEYTPDVIFTVSILEPTTGGSFSYPEVTGVSLYMRQISTAVDSVDSMVLIPPAGVWTDYAVTQASMEDDDYLWNASAESSAGKSWTPHVIEQAADSGLKGPGERDLKVFAKPIIQVTPNPLNFGNVEKGSTKEMTVTIKNIGGVDLDIDTIDQIVPSEFAFSTTSPETACETTTLAYEASCTFKVTFTPGDTKYYGDDGQDVFEFVITSNDKLVSNSEEKVKLTGTGAYLPGGTEFKSLDAAAAGTPKLLYPNDNLTGVPTSLTFSWEPYKKDDINSLSYKLYYCETEDFAQGTGAGCSGITMTDESVALKNNGVYYYAGTGFGLLLFGIVLTGGIRERKKIMLVLAALIISSGMLFVACGDDDKSSVNTDDLTRSGYQVYAVDLASKTEYFWGVTAVDGSENETPSAKWSFIVE